MAGYNYEYMVYTKSPSVIDETLVQQLITDFKNRVEDPQAVEVNSELESGFVYFGVHSMGSVTHDTMEETFATFLEQLEAKDVQYVGYVHSYSDTVNDVETFDDPVYEEYAPIED